VVERGRPERPPAEAELSADDIRQLPAPLLAVPPMVDAIRAMRSGDEAAAARAIDSAIALSETPSLAVTPGFLAIDIGQEQLARKAALRALSFAALYPRARILAARVALLGGRLDEAQKAVEELEPSSADVAVVRAALAYEALEPGDLDSALAALGDKASDPAFTALRAASSVLKGGHYPKPDELVAMANSQVPWGELVAVDAALETGNLTTAERILGARTVENSRPVHALRLARLRRYQGKTEEALAASSRALEANMTPPLLIERTYELLDADKVAEARTFVAKHPSVLGPMTAWLQALIEVSAKQETQAKARVAKLELPPEAAPLRLRLLAARALDLTGDKRASPYIKELRTAAPRNPELAALETKK
jgi:tetratricopeptide (TPR) repeat protein